MTTVLADPRRIGSTSRRGQTSSALDDSSALELPVLFQLSDLSVNQVLSPPGAPSQEESRPAKVADVAEPAPATPSTAAEAEQLAAEKSEVTADRVTNLQEPPNPKPADALPSNAGTAAPVEEKAADNSAAAPAADSPTIRERTQLRQRQRQAAVQGDWFHTQGKYIVVLFLIALVGIVFYSGRGDDSPPSPVDELGTANLEHEDGKSDALDSQDLAPADQAPALAADESADKMANDPPPMAVAQPAIGAMSETSPAEGSQIIALPAEEVPEADSPVDPAPQVSLQAPLAPGQRPARSDDENLFPWNGQEERVAARPDPTRTNSSVPMPQRNPHYQARPQTTGADAPATPSPAPSLPDGFGDRAAPAVYPVTDPTTYRSAPPPRGTAADGAAPASHETRTPPAPRTSGPRYERTGSGLY